MKLSKKIILKTDGTLVMIAAIVAESSTMKEMRTSEGQYGRDPSLKDEVEGK